MAWLRNKKGIAGIVALFAVMMLIGILVGGQLNNIFFESVQTKEAKGKNINILLMGIDARNAKENSRSDTMILASLDTTTQQVVMISIPRDTRIKNSSGHYDKINSINLVDGPQAACREVSDIMNIPVDYYVVTNFGGFGDIVDALGGVHINVESNMYHADPVNPELAINLKKGYQYLNGQQALAYVRYRGGPTADIGRTENQQKFIKALAAEMLQTKTILKLPQLIPELYKNVNTNLPLQDMVYLGKIAQKMDMNNIITLTLPGYFLHDNSTGASYWEADKKIASTLIEDLKKGETIEVVQEAPPGAQPAKTNIIPAVAQTKPESTESQVKSETGSDVIPEDTEPGDEEGDQVNEEDPDSEEDPASEEDDKNDKTGEDKNTNSGDSSTPENGTDSNTIEIRP